MTKYIIGIACWLQVAIAWAHQPDVSSTVLMEQKDGTWLLQIKAALTAFEYEVEAMHGSNSYTSPQEFEALVLEHLQKNIQIISNEATPLELEHGYVQLGHETNVLFQIKQMPAHLKQLTITNTSFKDIYHNQSALMVLKEGFQQQQFVLKETNQHRAQLQVQQNSFVLLAPATQAMDRLPLAALGIALVLGLFLLFLYRRKASFAQA